MRRFRPRALLPAATWGLLFLGFALGCTPRVSKEDPHLTALRADSLLTGARQAFASGDMEAAERAARTFVTQFPQHEHADEAYFLGARASFTAGNYAQSATYAGEIRDRFPVSPRRIDALLVAADAYSKMGRYYESADALCRVLSSPIDEETEAKALARLRSISFEMVSVTELEKLIAAYPGTPLAGEMSLGMAKREFARGNYDRSYELLTELLYEFPEHKSAPEVRHLLELSAARRDDPARTSSYVEPYKIGVLLPYTGGFSRFGRYFEQGVELAFGEYNASAENALSFIKADTKGDPIDAVEAVRRLIVEDGVVGVLGGVLTVPTIAAAVECNGWKVPMLAPVVSEERVDEVGPWIFQTKVASEIEVTAMAEVAVEVLLLRRFAVLSPSSPERRKLAELFIEELQHRGAEVVAEQYYNKGDTDFKKQLDVIRDAAPEALFIPGDTEELVYVLPQIGFYDMQIQLLGLSNWNSEKLLRLSQRELEGALFPREAYHGKDRESDQRFVSMYKEKYGGEVHAVAAAGYFGARFMLESFARGAIDRTQVRDYLDNSLNTGASERMNTARNLTILKVTSGRVREFSARGE